MKLSNIVESDDSEWVSQREPLTVAREIRRRMLLLNHQADLMMDKFEKYAKVYKGQVFSVTGQKSGMQLPKPVAANPRKYQSFTCVHDNPNIATKIFVDTDFPKIVLSVRNLVSRHNELTNQRGALEGELAKLKQGRQ